MKTLPIYAAAIALLSGVGAAQAADVYSNGSTKDPVTGLPVSAAQWTGFEVFGQVGYGFSGSRSDIVPTFTDTSGLVTGTKGKAVAFDALGFEGGSGLVGGVGLGYLYQPHGQQFVFGIETEFNGADVGKSTDTNLSYAGHGLTITSGPSTWGGKPTVSPITITTNQQLDWYGTTVGKLGVTLGPVLLYGTGGLAYGSINDGIKGSFSVVTTAPTSTTPGVTTTYTQSIKSSGIDVGYAIGGGAEYKVSQSWSFGVDYKYINLGSRTVTGTVYDPTTTPKTELGKVTTTKFDDDFHTILARATYHFGNN